MQRRKLAMRPGAGVMGSDAQRGGRSDGRNGSAIDGVLGARYRGRAVRRQEGDQAGDLLGFCRAAYRDTTQRLHDELLAAFVVGPLLLCEALGETHRCLGLDPAGRDSQDPDAFRRDFLGQTLL